MLYMYRYYIHTEYEIIQVTLHISEVSGCLQLKAFVKQYLLDSFLNIHLKITVKFLSLPSWFTNIHIYTERFDTNFSF